MFFAGKRSEIKRRRERTVNKREKAPNPDRPGLSGGFEVQVKSEEKLCKGTTRKDA